MTDARHLDALLAKGRWQHVVQLHITLAPFQLLHELLQGGDNLHGAHAANQMRGKGVYLQDGPIVDQSDEGRGCVPTGRTASHQVKPGHGLVIKEDLIQVN